MIFTATLLYSPAFDRQRHTPLSTRSAVLLGGRGAAVTARRVDEATYGVCQHTAAFDQEVTVTFDSPQVPIHRDQLIAQRH